LPQKRPYSHNALVLWCATSTWRNLLTTTEQHPKTWLGNWIDDEGVVHAFSK